MGLLIFPARAVPAAHRSGVQADPEDSTAERPATTPVRFHLGLGMVQEVEKAASLEMLFNAAGTGSYGSVTYDPGGIVSTNKGAIYGSPLLVPLVGGSGGGGSTGSLGGGGHGGGGAILIASNTRIDISNSGSINANSVG